MGLSRLRKLVLQVDKKRMNEWMRTINLEFGSFIRSGSLPDRCKGLPLPSYSWTEKCVVFVRQIRTPFVILLFLNPLSSCRSDSFSASLCSAIHTCFATYNIAPHKTHISTRCKSKPAHHEVAQTGSTNLFTNEATADQSAWP